MSLNTHFPTNQALKKERIYIRYNVSEWQNNWPLHTHDGYEIYVFIQGNVNYIIGDEIYQLQPGDMLLFSGDIHHRVNPARDTPYIRSYINFMPDFIQEMVGEELLEKLMSLFGHTNGLLIRWDDQGIAEVNEQIMKIYKEREKEAVGSDFMMRSLLVQLLLQIYRMSKDSYAQPSSPAQSMKESNVRQMLTYLNLNYRNSFTLDELAGTMHLNKYYMCHCFKEVTGFSINNYIARRRVEEAKRLLQVSNEPIGRLSEQLGFGNSIHFSRLFKQYVGVSPQMYRKNNRE